MGGWLAVGFGAGAVEIWALRRRPNDTLSRICGRHPILTAVVAAAFIAHTHTHRIPWRRQDVQTP